MFRTRRLAVLTAALAITALGTLAASATAHAATYAYSGKLVDYNGGAPISGRTLTFTPPAGAGPVVTVTTAADGTWSFTSGLDEYGQFVDGGTWYQSGYRDCFGNLTPAAGDSCTFGPGAGLVTKAFASFVDGRIIDTFSRRGVQGAVVKVLGGDLTVIGTSTTDAAGYYRITGLAGDEFSLYVNGAPARHRSGWFGCSGIVATSGAACTFAPGHQATRAISAVLLLAPSRKG